MQLLLKLLGANVQNADAISSVEIGWQAWSMWPLALILGLFGGGIAWWLYRRSPVQLPVGRRWVLTALRATAWAVLALILLQPTLTFALARSTTKSFLVLLDASESMNLVDPRSDASDIWRAACALGLPSVAFTGELPKTTPPPELAQKSRQSRFDLLRAVLADHQRSPLYNLPADVVVSTYVVNDKVISAAETDLSQLRPSGSKTAIVDAVREVVAKHSGENVAGILVASDGANNSGASVSAISNHQSATPIHFYAVGTVEPSDLAIGNVQLPAQVLADEQVPVRVEVANRGLAGQSVTVDLRLGEDVVAEQSVLLPDAPSTTVELSFTPPTTGHLNLTASVRYPGGAEISSENNHVVRELDVMDERMRILYIEQSPRWEFKYLQAMLLREKRVELKCYLAEADPLVTRGFDSPYLKDLPSRRADLFSYDLVILGDINPQRISSQQMQNLVDYVSTGGSMISLAGKRFNPSAYRRTGLSTILPVEVPLDVSNNDNKSSEPISLQLTKSGARQPMLFLAEKPQDNASTWNELPSIYWTAPVGRSKPAAEVLLAHRDRVNEHNEPRPVMAWHRYGGGEVLFIGTDNAWRWRKNVGDRIHARFWAQVVQRMGGRRMIQVSPRTQIDATKKSYDIGETVTVTARLYSTDWQPLADSTVEAILQSPSNVTPKSVALQAIPGKPGRYRAELSGLGPDRYTLKVLHDESTSLAFAVESENRELAQVAMNESFIEELTSATGGRVFRAETLHELPDVIDPRPAIRTSRVRADLWASPLMFACITICLSSEWLLRRLWELR